MADGRISAIGHERPLSNESQIADNARILTRLECGPASLHAIFRMTTKQRFITALLGALAWIIIDQLTKALFKQILTPGEVVPLFAGSVLVLPIYNHGAFLSLGAGMSDTTRNLVFIYGVLAILAGVFWWLGRSSRLRRIDVIAMACILGGGLSNLLDRSIYHGQVFDFLNIGIGRLRTGVFNLADVGIMLGVALLLFSGKRRGPTLPGSATA
jgi:signal peptidase II